MKAVPHFHKVQSTSNVRLYCSVHYVHPVLSRCCYCIPYPCLQTGDRQTACFTVMLAARAESAGVQYIATAEQLTHRSGRRVTENPSPADAEAHPPRERRPKLSHPKCRVREQTAFHKRYELCETRYIIRCYIVL